MDLLERKIYKGFIIRITAHRILDVFVMRIRCVIFLKKKGPSKIKSSHQAEKLPHSCCEIYSYI